MTTPGTSLPYQLDHVITIDASPETVFSFLSDTDRWARWWGTGSTIEPSVGGHVLIHHANGVEVTGEVLAVEAPYHIAFTYGYTTGPLAPGHSRVSIRIEPADGSSRVRLAHEFEEEAPRDQHVQGWRYQLALLANVVTDLLHEGAPTLVDRWFSTWNDQDPLRRREAMLDLVTPDVRFKDKYGLTGGTEELLGHIAAVHQFMPGLRLERVGDVRHCQGLVLADWKAVGADNAAKAQGTNAFALSPEGRIAGVTGFWSATRPEE